MIVTIFKSRVFTLAASMSVVAALVAVYIFFLFSARDSASAAIDNADHLIQRAALTCGSGSEGAIKLDSSQALLNGARDKVELGSLFNRQAYVEAKNDAELADDVAENMIDEMEQAYDAALAALDQANFDPVFSFYIQYPRTEEAEVALSSAERSLNIQGISMTIGRNEQQQIGLQKIADFNARYPKPEKSASVIESTGNILVDMAFENVTQLDYFASYNKSSLENIASTHSSQKLKTMSDEIINGANSTIRLMPNLYMPVEIQQLYSKLVEADSKAEAIDHSLEGNALLNDAQISDLIAASDELAVVLNDAKILMADVKARYYHGNLAAQAGYAAGYKAAGNVSAGN